MNAFLIDHRAWLWPILIMAILTPFTPAIDLAIAGHYFFPNGFSSNAFFDFLYKYGPIPALAIFGISLIALALSYFASTWRRWRRPALCLFLTMAVGAELITHILLKDHWGRPRPKQVIEFGGQQPFRPYYEPNFFHQPEPSKSFPCGHCTVGFYFFSLALVGKRLGSRSLFWGSLGFAVALGSLLAWTRMAQGGHFFSDTVTTALIMWLTAYTCDQWIYKETR